MIEVTHFGDNCEPYMIINDILKNKKKHLFMLGMYAFNNILSYLKDNNYEKIYDKEDLVIEPNQVVKHSKYNFIFNHDYQVSNSQINNYDFIRERFDLKIKNFKEMLSTENMCVFLSFSENVPCLKLNEMLDWLSLNKKNFHLMIFTCCKHDTICDSEFCSIINLEHSYHEWWLMEKTPKMILYEEIYEKFLNCLNQRNIQHDFPAVFEL